MRRRQFIAGIGSTTVVWPLAVRAQRGAMPIVGFLSPLTPAETGRPLAAFREALADAGYVDGKNVAIEYRWGEGRYEQLPALAADLVQRRVAVIVTVGGDPSAFAAKAASITTPIVFLVGRDPVDSGLVTSLSRPGGNATGVNLFINEIGSKRIDLLRKLVPVTSKFAVLVNPKRNVEIEVKDMQSAANLLRQEVKIIYASNDDELDIALANLARDKVAGLTLAADPFFLIRRDKIISFAAEHRIPAVYFIREFVDAGGLMSYGTSLADAYRQVGAYVAKILNGAKPAELPVVQPTKFELVINRKVAKSLGIEIPDNLLATADEVIE